MTLIIVGIGMKDDCVSLIKSGKKVVIVISVNQKSYVSIVIGGRIAVFVLMNVV